MDGRLGLGTTLKQLHVGFGDDGYGRNAVDANGNAQAGMVDPVRGGSADRSAMAVDFGAIYRLSPAIRLGFAALNANQPDIGLADTARAARTLAIGASAKLGRGLLSSDLSRHSVLEGTTDTIFALGYELAQDFHARTVFLRAGGRVGSRDQRQLNMGFGLRFGGLQIDYSLTLPLAELAAGNNSNQVSLGYRFGQGAGR
jgi:hypothetical protein